MTSSREHVADGILRAVCRPGAEGSLAEIARLVVAEPVGKRLEVGHPAIRPEVARGADHAIRGARGSESCLVDRRHVMAQRPAGPRRSPAAGVSGTAPRQASGPATSSGRRFRSDPLTRIRNE